MSARAPVPPAPLATARIEAYLRSCGYESVHDDDGDLTGVWNSHRFWFIVMGESEEILQVRGRWNRLVPVDERAQALLALNDWNRDRIWPKAYLRPEDGGLAVYGEVSADLEHGVTDAQLAEIVDCGLGTCVQFFAGLESLLPVLPS
ncbi:YbjN domain-containing protein [Actinotalea sp.]|uniref:YbjN domain-containing protein n=1 Tax=Actinotalea sp. TaxID=1872145 RepID=UPI00356B1714